MGRRTSSKQSWSWVRRSAIVLVVFHLHLFFVYWEDHGRRIEACEDRCACAGSGPPPRFCGAGVVLGRHSLPSPSPSSFLLTSIGMAVCNGVDNSLRS